MDEVTMEEYPELEKLVEAERFDEAEELCLTLIQNGHNPKFWKTQLGYVQFLNEKDVESFYIRAPDSFAALVQEYPDDANAHLWLAYISSIAFHDYDKAKAELWEALELNPLHPYANLVLSSYLDAERNAALLETTLQVQPFNYRALKQLAQVYASGDRTVEANNLLRSILENHAYVEEGYGIMNRYMNSVLTHATREEVIRNEVRKQLGMEE